jgi:signal transduction histidine kinase
MPVRLGVAIAAVLVGAVLGSLSLIAARAGAGFSFAGESLWGAAILLIPGLAMFGVGAIYLSRRSGPLLGLLLSLTGAAWFIVEWDNPAIGSPLAFSAGLLLYAVCPAVVLHVVLAYPTGRLRSNPDRVVVVAGYLTMIMIGLIPTLYFDPVLQGCVTCPDNLAAVWSDPSRFNQAGVVGMRLGLAWTILAIVLVCWHFAAASSTRRRVEAPIVAPGLLFLACAGWRFGLSWDRPHLGSSELDQRLWTAQCVALLLLAAGVGWGLLRTRRTHQELTRLVVDLDRAGRSGQMRPALAKMLGDPQLVIAYPRGGGRYVDGEGQPVDIGVTGRTVMATPLHRDRREIAVLLHRRGLLDNPALVEEIVSATHLGLENERLTAEGLAQLADLRASRVRIVEAADEERRRLERDLHDGAQQRLVGLALALRLARTAPDADTLRLAEAETGLRAAIDELRDLARGLYPVALREDGLAAALTGLAESAPLRIVELPQGRFAPVIETTAYLLVARAAALGECTARVSAQGEAMVVEIDSASGLEGIEDAVERVSTLDGDIKFARRDGGTRVTIRIPLSEPTTSLRSDFNGAPVLSPD